MAFILKPSLRSGFKIKAIRGQKNTFFSCEKVDYCFWPVFREKNTISDIAEVKVGFSITLQKILGVSVPILKISKLKPNLCTFKRAKILNSLRVPKRDIDTYVT